MDISTRTQEAIAEAVKRMNPSSAERVNALNVKFDRMIEQGLIKRDSCGIAVGWVEIAQCQQQVR